MKAAVERAQRALLGRIIADIMPAEDIYWLASAFKELEESKPL